MQYVLKLKEGEIKLLFSTRFLGLLCELSDTDLDTVFTYVIGKTEVKKSELPIADGEKPQDEIVIHKGMMKDLNVRANILAAAIETQRESEGNPKGASKIEAFSIMDQMESHLVNKQWGEMYGVILGSLFPEGLPKQKKKEAAKK